MVIVAGMGVFALAMVHGLVEVGFTKATVTGVFVGDDNRVIGNIAANGICNALECRNVEGAEFAVALQSALYDSLARRATLATTLVCVLVLVLAANERLVNLYGAF